MFVPASFTQVFTRPSQIQNVSICEFVFKFELLIFLFLHHFRMSFSPQGQKRAHSDTVTPVDVSNHTQNLLQFVSEVCGASSNRSSVARAGLKRTKLAARRRK